MSLSQPEKQTEENSIKAAAVIPAYQAEAVLAGCLESLLGQELLPDRLELQIIVVDDGSSDATAAVARRYADRGVQLVRTAHRGAAAARNAGVRQAGPDCRVILFTDADCEASPGWAACLAQAMLAAGPAVAGIKGAYATRQLSAVARFSQLEFEERYARFKQQRIQPDFADTYSAAYRAELLRTYPFDERLPGAIVEDAELGWRLRQAGYTFSFVPEAVVYHHHPVQVSRYFRRKFRIAHWRVAVYRRYPGRLPSDTHTAPGNKGQMLLLAGAFTFFCGWAAARVAPARCKKRTIPGNGPSLRAGVQILGQAGPGASLQSIPVREVDGNQKTSRVPGNAWQGMAEAGNKTKIKAKATSKKRKANKGSKGKNSNFSPGGWEWGRWTGQAALLCLAALQASLVPFINRAYRYQPEKGRMKGVQQALVSWYMLNVRAIAYTSGAVLGLAELLIRESFRNELKASKK